MRLLAEYPRNTRNSVIVEPLWALFSGVIVYFAPLYMRELGLSDLEMGLVNSTGLFFSFVFFLLAGPITNKYGRHPTTLIWDLLSWTVSMVLWALAQNFAWFLVAVLFNSAVRVTMVSWNLLTTEDAAEEQRVKIFALVTLLGSLGGFVSLAAGLLLDTFGVIPTMRVTYGLGAVFMTTMFVVRYFLTTETENGRRVKEASRDRPLLRLVWDQVVSLRRAARDGHFAVLTVVFLINMAVQSFTFFQILYLKANLGYSNTELAVVPAVNSLLTLLLFWVVLPRIPRNAERLGLLISFLVCMASALAFLLLGPGMLIVVLAVQGFGMAAYVLLATYRDAVFMNSVPEAQRAELLGVVNMLSMLLSVPTGWLAGWLFSWNPLAPFAVVALLFALGAWASAVLMAQFRAARPR